MLQDKILAELKRIPETKLAELYDIIHHYRLDLEREQQENPTMKLAGTWADMPAEQFQSLLDDIGTRRNRSLSPVQLAWETTKNLSGSVADFMRRIILR